MDVRARQGDTVDQLCRRHLGSTAGGVVEATYELNPGLAELGPVLPEGTAVTLATPSTTTPTTSSNTVSLWD
jgi:phage tail protein X